MCSKEVKIFFNSTLNINLALLLTLHESLQSLMSCFLSVMQGNCTDCGFSKLLSTLNLSDTQTFIILI